MLKTCQGCGHPNCSVTKWCCQHMLMAPHVQLEFNQLIGSEICNGCGHPDCGTFCCKHFLVAPHYTLQEAKVPELEANTNPAPRIPRKPAARQVKETYHFFLRDILAEAGIEISDSASITGSLPQNSGKLTIIVTTEEHG